MTTDPTKSVLLVPLDGSRMAERAAGMAAAVGRHVGCRIVLLAVPEVYGLDAAWYARAAHDAEGPLVPVEALLDEARQSARKTLDENAAALAGQGLTVDSVLVDDAPARAIVATATDRGAWLIVMATHGRGGLSRWAFGSVADKVLHTSHTPVLLVRVGAEHLDPKLDQIMVALDGSHHAEAVLDDARRIAAAAGGRMLLVHVVEEPTVAPHGAALLNAQVRYRRRVEERLSALVDDLRAQGVNAALELLSGDDVAETLLQRQEASEIDLVCLTTHGSGGMERWAFGSVADRVLRSARSPVLIRRSIA